MDNKSDLAFPAAFGDVTQYQILSSGLTKFEYFALHLMASSVTANDHTHPSHTGEDMAKQHAKNAVRLAKALLAELEKDSAKKVD